MITERYTRVICLSLRGREGCCTRALSRICLIPRTNFLQNGCLLLIDLLHLGGLIGSSLYLLKGRKIIVIAQAFIVVFDAQAQFDHAMDAPSELGRLVEIEARCEKGGIEQDRQRFDLV